MDALIILGSPSIGNLAFGGTTNISEVLNLGTTQITPTTGGMANAEVRTDIDALGYVAPTSVTYSEQTTIESPTADVLAILPLLAGVGVLMIGVGAYISRRY